MTLNDVFHWIGTGIFLFYAIVSAIRPRFVAQVLEHSLTTGRGVSEFRVLHGGFILGLSLFTLYINQPLVYRAVGCAWMGAAVIRLLAYLPDHPTRNISLLSFAGEFVLGILLLV